MTLHIRPAQASDAADLLAIYALQSVARGPRFPSYMKLHHFPQARRRGFCLPKDGESR